MNFLELWWTMNYSNYSQFEEWSQWHLPKYQLPGTTIAIIWVVLGCTLTILTMLRCLMKSSSLSIRPCLFSNESFQLPTSIILTHQYHSSSLLHWTVIFVAISTYLSFYLSIYLSIYLCIYLSIYLYIYMYVYQFISIYLYIYIYTYFAYVLNSNCMQVLLL